MTCQLVEHREVEGERLPRGGAGRHEHVCSSVRRLPHGALVLVELWHRHGVAHARVELVRQRPPPCLARGLGDEVRQLLTLEQPLPTQHVDAHLADASLALPGCPARG